LNAAGLFLSGIVEGFYGRQWPHSARLAYAGILAGAGLNCYLYCPKGDPFLRKRWQEHWPAGEWARLAELSAACARAGVAWGVGLSPFELYRDYSATQRRNLRDKVARLAELEGPILAILFDDMPGDLADLAHRQAEIVADVSHWQPHVRLLVCPTYYSFDPQLQSHFGAMPEGYWPQLGAALPEGVDIFWTGNRVCAEAVAREDIVAIRDALARPVMLWDNYPVNDGAVRSEHLYTRALPDRDAGLSELLTGHLCNPMNQALASLPALAGLAARYGTGIGEAALAQLLGEQTLHLLRRDAVLFEEKGLPGLDGGERERLAAEYAGLPGEAAREVAGWLRGEYRFDPACLTG